MNYFDNKEKTISNKFFNDGYFINNSENKLSFNYIEKLFAKNIQKILDTKKKINLNYLHNYISIKDLNNFRLTLISYLNKDKQFRFHYFNIARNSLYILAGNELMMQKNINLSIQFPNDESSLLPIHSDVWSGDSPYEINLWVPLVNCYRTKSMYILTPKYNNNFNKIMKKKKFLSNKKIYNLVKKKIKWLKIDRGSYLLFNQSLPHGNVVNLEKQTRVSMNCRFKNLFSPYGDKKIGEFFTPITTRAITELGMDYQYPFNL
jgi:sporadic carbohydrate cluster 2OG-Fe(II) oxygenase